MKLSNLSPAEIIADFVFHLDIHGETFDRYTGTVVAKGNPNSRFRVKIMKNGTVRESFCNATGTYCDPKLSTGRAKAVLTLFNA